MRDTAEHAFEDILRDMVASLIEVRVELSRVRAEVAEVREESRHFHRGASQCDTAVEVNEPMKKKEIVEEEEAAAGAEPSCGISPSNLALENIDAEDDDQSFVKLDKHEIDTNCSISSDASSTAPTTRANSEEENEQAGDVQPLSNIERPPLPNSATFRAVPHHRSAAMRIHGPSPNSNAELIKRRRQYTNQLSVSPFCFLAVAIVVVMALIAARWIPVTRLPSGAGRAFKEQSNAKAHHDKRNGHNHREHAADSKNSRQQSGGNNDNVGVLVSAPKRIDFAGNQPESKRIAVLNRNRHRYVVWWVAPTSNDSGAPEDEERYDYWRVLNLGSTSSQDVDHENRPDPHLLCGVLAPSRRQLLEIVKRGFPLKLSGTLHDTLRVEWMELNAYYDDEDQRFDEIGLRRAGCATWLQQLHHAQRRNRADDKGAKPPTQVYTVELVYKL